MVLGQIVREGFRIGVKAATRYYRVEGKAFNKLYTGFPRSSVIGRGVRHGLTAGSVAGTLITDDDNQLNGGSIQKFPKKQPKTGKPYKTRYRPTTRFSTKCPTEFYPRKFSGKSNYSRYS